MTIEVTTIRFTAVLTFVLWFKVWAVNIGLGGTKLSAGLRAPEDSQVKTEDAAEGAKEAADRAQRMVNNDLENIPYTMLLAWAAVFCITFDSPESVVTTRETLSVLHIIFYSIFVVCRIFHSVSYALGFSKPRTVFYLLGCMSSFAISIIAMVAVFSLFN